MSTASTALTPVYNDRQMAIIRDQIAKGASDEELAYFLEVCRLTGLNPLQKQIYAIMRYSDGRQRMTIQTGIDGYRLLAARTHELAGIDDAVYDSEESEHPKRATVTVYRKSHLHGERVAYTATARWSEYVQTDRSGNPTSMWKKMPYLMLAKCAEALALRKAFPAELSGLYTAEEMSQADSEPFRPEPTQPKARHLNVVEEAASYEDPDAPGDPLNAMTNEDLAGASRALASQLGIAKADYAKAFAAQVNDGRLVHPNDITREQRLKWYAYLCDLQDTQELQRAAENAAGETEEIDLSTLDPQDVKVS